MLMYFSYPDDHLLFNAEEGQKFPIVLVIEANPERMETRRRSLSVGQSGA